MTDFQQPAYETIDVDTITEIGERVPAGRYNAKLIACEGKLSKKNKPMVQATFEVTQGEYQAMEIVCFYSLAVSEKKSKRYAGGILEIKAALNAVGTPLPQGYQFPLDMTKAANLYAKALANKNVDIVVYDEKYTDKETGQEKSTTRAKVVQKGAATATAANPTGKPTAGIGASSGSIFDDL